MKNLIIILILSSYSGLSLALIRANSVDLQSNELTTQSSTDGRQLASVPIVSTTNLEQTFKIKKHEAALAAFYLSVRYAAKNDLVKAKYFVQQAIQLQPENARYLHTAFQIDFQLENYTEAKIYQLKAINQIKSKHGQKNEQLLMLLDELVMIYMVEKQYLDAEALLYKTLQIRKKILVLNHPDIALNLYRLASVKMKRGDYELVEQQLQQALEILNVVGDQNSTIPSIFHIIGELYQLQEKYPEAETSYRKAISLWRVDPVKYKEKLTKALNNLEKINTRQKSNSDVESVD